MIQARFATYIRPVLRALIELGGSGRAGEVIELVAEREQLTDEVVEAVTESGHPQFRNDVSWARFYLVKADCIDASQRGVWSITDRGRALADGTDQEISELVQSIRAATARTGTERGSKTGVPEAAESGPVDAAEDQPFEVAGDDHRTALLQLLKSVSPNGFERICQRLLREAGFESVEVTGRSSDGGIDGNGVLQVNPFVSFKVLFQCKRYAGSVGAPVVRDFRGAMQGRADKGIILTTGTFTVDAKREAVRDGVPPIELVDGEDLVDMFEQLELGLTPRTAFDVDEAFFREFMN